MVPANLSHRTVILILIAFTLAVYANSLFDSFVWDDYWVVVDNNFIKSWKNFPLIFSKDYLASAYVLRYQEKDRLNSGELTYRPVVTVSYFIDYALYNLRPWGYHFTNIILHMFNGVLLYFLICLIVKNKQLSFLSSLLFILHPVNVEVVNCISFREDLLAFLFFISSLILFIKFDNYGRGKKVYIYAISLLLYVLALFSKEMAITLPLILMSYDYYFVLGRNIKKVLSNFKSRYLGYILVSLFYLWFVFFYMVNKQRVPSQYPGGNFYINFLTMSKVVATYIKSLFLPLNIYGTIASFAFDPSFAEHSLLSLTVLASLFLIFICLFVVIKLRRILPIVSFSIAWFFLALMPVYNIIPLDNIMAWRYLYIPSVGFCLLAASLLLRLKTAKKYAIIAVLLFYSIFTIIGNMFWKDSVTLWLETQRHYPKNVLVYNNIGCGYGIIGKHGKAIDFFHKAIEVKPDYTLAYYNLGLSYMHIGRIEQAIPFYEKAIELCGDFVQAYHGLAYIYLTNPSLNKVNDSISLYEKVIEIYPASAEAYNNMGVAYEKLGNIKEAIRCYNKAVEINPQYAGAYYNLASAHKQIGEEGAADRYYTKAKEVEFVNYPIAGPFISPVKKSF